MASDVEDIPPSDDPAFDAARRVHLAGDLAQAQALYRALLKQTPGHPGALQMLGLVALQDGQPEPAVHLLSGAIAVAPTSFMYFNRAVALDQLGRHDDAVADYAKAATARPAIPEAHQRLAASLQRLGRLDDAAEIFRAAALLWPMAAWPLTGHADVLGALGRHAEALDLHSRALALSPDLLDARIGRARALSALSRPQEALAEYDAALLRNETSVAALYNRSLALRTLGRTAEAAQACERVIALQPDLAMAHMHLAVCRLQLGDLLGGFTGYEWRKQTSDFVDHRYESPLNWRGEDLTGRTLYIYPERFLGDMIQFCRYAAEAERRGVRVMLAAQRPLHALLRSLSSTIALLEPDEAPSAFDAQCALLSLPLAFGAEIPASVPYLAAESDRQNRWRRRVGPAGFKIGVCWQGSTKAYAEPLQRSFRLDQLAPLAADPAVRLISLQKNDGLDQLDALPAGMRVETFDDADAGPDAFVDTAAIIMACDLVVTADTAIAHLAGALGRPVWVALPALAEWRWMEARDDSPWYPSMRLFRQRIQGQWGPVFDDMAQALKLARH